MLMPPTAAVVINRLVAERFSGELRIGIGINTGVVIGGGSKLEFTLIGDTVNVTARVGQLTKPPVMQSFSPSSASTPWHLDRPD